MRLVQLRLRNFRCYRSEISIDFDDITALVGKNDSGKSTFMDALEIFFNDGLPDKHDASKDGKAEDVAVICVFSDLPEEVVLDQSAETAFSREFLLNPDGNLEIHKVFNGSLEKPKLSALEVMAIHPTEEKVSDLIGLSNSDLKKRAQEVGVSDDDADKTINAELRNAIRDKVGELALAETHIDLTNGNGKNVWKGIQAILPAFALFRSDRPSTDQDPEAQDPLKAAIKEALKEKETELQKIAEYVESEVKKIADKTLEKLKEMDPNLASTLSPTFGKPSWASLFKASITGDDAIPINKRGSGVRRLILLNFFRAKAERLMVETEKATAIYAVEEPETSQHPRNQRMLVSALTELSVRDQVFLTTHTPMLARAIPAPSLRFVTEDEIGERKIVVGGEEETNRIIAESLGVLPDHNVRLFVAVEGKNDIPFLKHMSRVLRSAGEDVPDLESLEIDGQIIFTPLGGSQLALWCNRLANLNRPEFHLYDRDTSPPADPKYKQYMDQVNARHDCKAVSTNKLEAENYIHVDAINAALANANIAVTVTPFTDFDDVPSLVYQQVNQVIPQGRLWGSKAAKEFICSAAASHMTKGLLDAIDPNGEVLGWFEDMNIMLEKSQ